MASIGKDKNGRRRILFVAPDGKRKTIRLGKVSQRDAEGFKLRVEHLLASKMTGRAIEADTARWVAELPERLAERLSRVGLIPKPEHKVDAELARFIEAYIVKREDDTSPDTRRIWRQTARKLADYFGPKRLLVDITRGDAKDWRLSLISSGLADASVRKHCGFAKHFVAQAMDISQPTGKQTDRT